jgi:hypothetical protein
VNDQLVSHPRVRVALPLELDQVDFADASATDLPDRTAADRLITAAPSIVATTPIRSTPPAPGTAKPLTFLRTDRAGLVPYSGAGGDERDTRVWAFLAFVRNSSIVKIGSTLPRVERSSDSADPSETVWFYPGKWFGTDQPLPTLQLKWMRRAQQDFEYLRLAEQRGQRINAQLIARLLTKPVEIGPTQPADPIYSLMTGTIDPVAWTDASALLARTILSREPGAAMDQEKQNELNRATLQWLTPQERPLLLPRSTLFATTADPNAVETRVGIDLYNASDAAPDNNQLSFTKVPPGWTIEPEPAAIPPLATYRVQPQALKASVNPEAFDPRRVPLVEMTFTHGFTRQRTSIPLVVPVAPSKRREGNLVIDGSLGDWTDDDAVTLAQMVRLIDRPTVQGHSIAFDDEPTSVYSCWAESNFYVGFRVSGLSNATSMQAANFVRYQFRRAWGEDVVQVLVQPVFADGTAGPVLHVACKPNGGQWTERKTDLVSIEEAAWESVEAGVRYATTVENSTWRGELAIPWRALVADRDKNPIVLLRFNFVQHRHTTGTTSSWAGPIDHGREDSFMGSLLLRDFPGR